MQSSITAWLRKPALDAKDKQSVPSTAPSQRSQPRARSRLEEDLSGHAKSQAVSQDSWVQSRLTCFNSLPSLPANVEFAPLSEDLIPGFKRLNALLFPISYPDVFYHESLKEPFHDVTLMALWRPESSNHNGTKMTNKPQLVGAIRCRILSSTDLYISTVGLLAPYRSYGIASHLLYNVVTTAVEQYKIECVTAHVWEANDEGLHWYAKQGFQKIGKEDHYYKKLKPGGAILVKKQIGVNDLLPSSPAASHV